MTIAFRLAFTLGILALCACGAADPPPRPFPADADPPSALLDGLSLTMPASTIAELRVMGRDGRLDVRAAHDDSVRIRVQLTGSGCDRPARGFDRSHRSNELNVRVQPSTKEKCDEMWDVELPGGIALTARMDRAEVSVRDLGGGVHVALGNGTIRANVRSGDLHLRVSKGNIVASSGSNDYEILEARAQVGDVDVTLEGRRIEHPRPPGPGDWLRLTGQGRGRVSLVTTVGNVRFIAGSAPGRKVPRPD